MTILNDIEIESLCLQHDMINPFVRKAQEDSVVSYGLSSYGYDARLAGDFKIFTNVHSALIDPKDFKNESFVEVQGASHCIIPPNSFVLARTKEYFKIPRDVLAVCVGKSTYARCGIIVNVTPLEPEWEGHVTLELSNTTPLPAKVYAEEGICQFLFLRGNPCMRSYKDKAGKYQCQTDITLPKIKELRTKYVALEIFDTEIRYNGKVIYSGDVRRLSREDIAAIVHDYKFSK